MAEIQRKSIYVQVMQDEAIESKKKLLEIEMSVLNIMKNFRKFKEIDREEARYIREIRRLINISNESFEKMLLILPHEEEGVKPIFKVKRAKLEIPREKDRIEQQLFEIRERLKQLGS